MTKQIRVSVILTSFNHAKYLREAIESVLTQTFTDFELIIWDDCSTDNSWEIIQEYSDPRIKSFRNDERKRGVWGINKAIREIAAGEYVAIHHSDDAWEPAKLAKQVAFLDANPDIGAVFTWARMVDEDGQPFRDEAHSYYKVFDQPNRNRHEWLNYFFYRGNALCHPSVLVRRQCYADSGVYRNGIAQFADLDLWVRVCMKHEIHVLPERLLRFRVRAGEANASGNRSEARVRSRLEFLKILDLYRSIGDARTLIEIFPEASKYDRNGKLNVEFALAMLALEAETTYPANGLRLFGWDILFSLLKDEEQSRSIAELYGFGANQFIELGGQHDVFLLESLEEARRQIVAAYGQLAAAQGQLVAAQQESRELAIYLEDARRRFQELTSTRAWRTAMLLQRVRALLVPHRSLRARIIRRVYSLLLDPFARQKPARKGEGTRKLTPGETPAKVGIVVVSYNASLAVRITLASLRQAKNDVATRMVLVDNASLEFEREQIRASLERHVREANLAWEYIQEDRNRGFAGGNNAGIRRLLEDPAITHICLLNSDVVVTDHWLDRLLESGGSIVSAVTNKAESEQCVPVDYVIKPEDCLDERSETIPAGALSRVRDFAEDWHQAWQGNIVEGEATFFCALMARPVLEDLGLLDEKFFPGGYEDEDFCLRARAQGYKILLARDVFIHHWGSASFGQLQYEYFNERARQNREYLEAKHGVVRRRRPEKPFISYLTDLRYAAQTPESMPLRQRFNRLYITQLGATLKHYESEFKNLSGMMAESRREVPAALQDQIRRAHRFDDVSTVWQERIASRADVLLAPASTLPEMDKVSADLQYVSNAIWERVECNFAMHAFLFSPAGQPGSQERQAAAAHAAFPGTLRRFYLLLKRLPAALAFLWQLHGVVIFGGYPYPERQSDGYFQRIQMVDRLFTGVWRVYVESDQLPGRAGWHDRPEANVLVLRIQGSPWRRFMVRLLALAAVLKCRKVYFHSVLRMNENSFGRLMHIPGITKLIDVHGAVPEEFRFHGDEVSAGIYEGIERRAVRHADAVVVVTQAMADHLRRKYAGELRGQVVLFPMFADLPHLPVSRPYDDGKPVIVYAGGIQKWQQVPRMIDAMRHTASRYSYWFFCPEPETVRNRMPPELRSKIVFDHKTPEQLRELYPQCHYGLILREDDIVNRVACPTKLVEYLAMGIVPIVDSENVGDFKHMGMQSVKLPDLLAGMLPDEQRRAAMADSNRSVYEAIREAYKQGGRQIQMLCRSDMNQGKPRVTLLMQAKALFPAYSNRGQVARRVWQFLNTLWGGDHLSRGYPEQSVAEAVTPPIVGECDVLVQVDNFEAGGLENIALDLNEALITAGHKVALLVLGTAGEGVQRARERGMMVLVASPGEESLRNILQSLKPKLVLAHYSLHGVRLYRQLGIPFVQIIQNAYMWFDRKQLEAFREAAGMTTAFIALSDYARDYSIRRLGVEASRAIVLPCGINSAAFASLDIPTARREGRAAHGMGEQDFVFLSVGAINHQKNHIATVRAFGSIATRFPYAKLAILGPAYEKSLLEEIELFIEKKRLRDRVIYLGSAPHAQSYYAMADALVSAAFFEGGPLNLLEALAANLPVVMTDVGLAGHFKGMPGIQILEPPLNIFQYEGPIWQLASTPAFEECLATAMARTCEERRRPNLAASLLKAFDRSEAYKPYIDVVDCLLAGNPVSGLSFLTWIDKIGRAN